MPNSIQNRCKSLKERNRTISLSYDCIEITQIGNVTEMSFQEISETLLLKL